MKNWKIAGVIALSTVSLIGVGFSAWVFGYEGPQRVSVQVNADDVVCNNTVDLEKIGFSLDQNPFESSLTYFSYSDPSDSSSEVFDSYGPVYFLVKGTLDLSKDIQFKGENYLKVTFTYKGYTSTIENLIDSLRIYPANYEYYDFPATISPTNQQKINAYRSSFYFPIRSESQMSLYDLASLDSTYPNPNIENGYAVPLVFRFDASNPKGENLIGSTIKIEFSLADKIE